MIIKNADNLIYTHLKKVDPVCPVFGRCGGCQYQDIPYEQELAVKDQTIAGLFKEHLNIAPEFCEPIVPSPQEYHYRNRLDLKIMRTKEGILFGFSTEGKNLTVPIDACPIAMQAISDVIPQLRKQTTENLPPKYRMANLVVRADTEGKVKWGGIGRRSLRLKEDDYLSTELDGRRIFYSLETFFQANLFILPKLIDHLKADLPLAADTVFFDLYGGVGLFGLCLSDSVAKAVLVEECGASIKLARYNAEHNRVENFEIVESRVENCLELLLSKYSRYKKVVMVDPPRQGLSPQACDFLSQLKNVEGFVYLSCHPDSLIRDLKEFLAKGWRIQKVVPFDFFPRTKHIETLVLLVKSKE